MYVHCLCAFVIRLGCIIYSNVHDSYSKVKYTDIDYRVFTDAAQYAWNGDSPFKRPTYRYSPILAYILTPNIFIGQDFGKILFSIFDILTSILIYFIQRHYYSDVKLCKVCANLWLYNPLPIVISTRGSSESLMTFLVMLAILLYIKSKYLSFGLVYGFAVHMKIYPCIYASSFYFVLSSSTDSAKVLNKFKTLIYPNKQKCIFLLSSAVGFILPTFCSAYLYGNEYIDEALLYHLRRKDVRHNFSPYFYLLYLSDTVSPVISSLISASSFIIQIFLISIVSWVFCKPQTLPSCLFIETFIFVTFNKVCTSQYFVWYVSLFPLCYPLFVRYLKYLVMSVSVWFLGQALWLIPAYYLEFQGLNMFFWVFLASLIFFLINVCLISMFIKLVRDFLKLSAVNKDK